MATSLSNGERLDASPAFITRKNQMMNLNNRLAVYVEKVRSLELKNLHLEKQIKLYEEKRFHEVDNIKAMFEVELHEARQLLDEVAKEKAELDIKNHSLQERLKDECTRADELALEKRDLNTKFKESNSLLSEKSASYEKLESDWLKATIEVDKLRKKLSSSEEELDSIRNALNQETLLRIDSENKLQSVQEELRFKKQVHEKEINEVRKRQDWNVLDATSVDHMDYENEMEAAIQDLRDEQSIELERLKSDMARNYTIKIENLTGDLHHSRTALFKSKELVKSHENKVKRLQDTLKILQDQIHNLENKVEDVHIELLTERELRVSAVDHAEEQRKGVMEELERLKEDYHELLEVKLKLDQEITVYSKLLEEEELRLHLSPGVGSDAGGRKEPRRSCKKRKRISGGRERRGAKLARSVMTSPVCGDEPIADRDLAPSPIAESAPDMERTLEQDPRDTASCSVM